MTLKKRWQRFRQRRMVHNSSFRRLSRSFSVFTSLTEVPPHSGNQVVTSILTLRFHFGCSSNARQFNDSDYFVSVSCIHVRYRRVIHTGNVQYKTNTYVPFICMAVPLLLIWIVHFLSTLEKSPTSYNECSFFVSSSIR